MSKAKAINKKGQPVKQFLLGEEVMGKWPGSPLWYEAVVVLADYDSNTYILKYGDGQENEVPVSHLERKRRFRPRSRSASPSRKPSPGRRRRSRSKSPSRQKPSPRKTSPGRPKRVPSQQIAKENSEDYDEKPPVSEGTVTVKSRTKQLRTPPRTAVGQQLEARVTRSALRQLEKHGVDTEALREELGKGLGDGRKPSSKEGSYEFGGPFVVVFMIFALPLLVLTSYVYCNKDRCWHLSEIFRKHKIPLPTAKQFLDPQAAAMVYGWIAFQAFLSLLPLGKVVEGTPLKDRTRLKYRLNGFSALIISIVALAACLYYKLPVADLIYKKFLGMITHAILLSYAMGDLLFLKAWFQNTGLSEGGNTGYHLYDYFMGKQLNPRIFNFDLKYFFELRPGLIGLVLIDLAMVVKAHQVSSATNIPLLLVCLFHILYVTDALWFESGFVSTPEVTKEGFGFMLAFGNIVWVPFIFSLQTRYLTDHPYTISPWVIALVLVLNGIGFIIYRVANLQKCLFREDPDHPAVQHLESMATGVLGKRLLVSGWWGYVRHPNYLGDIIMSIAWSLTCGFTHAIPYFYPAYLTILLVDRCFRDEADCRQKYGRSWDEYCKRVPYRIFPNIF